jgi:two-component system NtrC family response regulator
MAEGSQSPRRPGPPPPPNRNLSTRQVRDEADRLAVTASKAGGNIAQASELLGISRPTLYDLMAKTGIK